MDTRTYTITVSRASAGHWQANMTDAEGKDVPEGSAYGNAPLDAASNAAILASNHEYRTVRRVTDAERLAHAKAVQDAAIDRVARGTGRG